MTTIKDIRSNIDSGLDKLQAKAEALAAQVDMSDDDVEDRVAEIQDKLKDAAHSLNQKLSDSVSDETRTNIRASFEHLQVQLALGKADGRDAINAKRKQISRAIAEFNAQLDTAEQKAVAEELNETVKSYAEQAVTLEAELEAMEETASEETGNEETGSQPA